MEFLAKSNPKETVEEHTLCLLTEWERMKRIFPTILKETEWKLLYEACVYHDIGKINTKFQNKLGRKLGLEEREDILGEDFPEIQHGYLSPAFLPLQRYMKEKVFTKEQMIVLIQAIYYHHQRPPIASSYIRETLEKDVGEVYPFTNYAFVTLQGISYDYLSVITRKESIESESDREWYKSYVLIKGLLNKIDYAASGHIDVEIPPVSLGEVTEQKIDVWSNGKGVNDLQAYMKQHKEESLIAIASTGIGKTEGALLWIDNKKGFFTLPLQTSINAMYKRMKEKMELRDVGILHANMLEVLITEKEEEGEDLDIKLFQKMRQFSYPFTISTIDQLIDIIFGYDGFEMKLATLSYSKLVIDEIQMYQPQLVAYLLIALQKIQFMGGKFAIVTATLPPVFEHFMKRLRLDYTKAPESFFKRNEEGEILKRHVMCVKQQNLTASEIFDVADEGKKVLVIANTVSYAQELYRMCLGNSDYSGEIRLLHSRFIRRDRKEKEEQILQDGRYDVKKSCIWISTSLVEASLDIDFDILLTELSEVCSLFQRMGRTYRSREYQGEEPNVVVYSGIPYPSGVGGKFTIVDPVLFELSKAVLRSHGDGYISEPEKMRMVEIVYDTNTLRETNSQYYREIKTTIDKYENVVLYQFDKRDIDIRGIDSDPVIPVEIFRENKEYFESLRQAYQEAPSLIAKNKIKSKMEQYVVSIPDYRIQKGRVEDFEWTRFWHIPVTSYAYNSEEGLLYDVPASEDVYY